MPKTDFNLYSTAGFMGMKETIIPLSPQNPVRMTAEIGGLRKYLMIMPPISGIRSLAKGYFCIDKTGGTLKFFD